MASIAYKNEIMKRRFFDYLKNSKRFSDKTIEVYEAAIWIWEDFSHKADFAKFNKTAAESFRDWLKAKKKANSEKEVSLSHCYNTLRYLKLFFGWLSKQSGYKSKINESAVEFLNLSKAEVRVATQPKDVETPSTEEIQTVIESIKGDSEVERRDRALISLIFLTGARISAIRTLPMGSFDRNKLTIDQDPKRGVETKFSRKIKSALITFSYKEPLNYFLEWFDHLEKERKFKQNDPLFPATRIENGTENLGYHNTGEVMPIFWKSSSASREIFRKRFELAGVKYYHPHTLRHLLVKEITKLPLTEEQKKAFSQSLGHADVGTTFGTYGYGKIEETKQIDIIRGIDFEGRNTEAKSLLDDDSLERLAEKISKRMEGRQGSSRV